MVEYLADQGRVTLPVEAVPAFLVRAHALAHAGQSEEALACLAQSHLKQIADVTPGSESFISCMLVLGSTWRRLGRLVPAIEAYERVRTYRPDAAVLHELIALYRNVGRFTLAYERSQEAMAQWSHFPEIQSLHAECLISLGHVSEGIQLFEELINSGRAACDAHLLYAWYLSYFPQVTRQRLLKAHQSWAQRYADPQATGQVHDNDPNPGRRLKIGYLSSDFRTHSVAYTFEPLLEGRDRQGFEVYGYGNVAYPDETTARLKKKFDHYRDVRGLSAEAMARSVREDGIDILVGLATHCSVVCMQTLVLKPSPIQVDIGSTCSTGVSQVDYRITDALQDPPESQVYHTERLVHIPGGFIPYHAPAEAPPIGPLPALSCGQMTFGSFANHLKINDEVIDCWSRIMEQVPRSRLLIKATGGHDEGVTDLLVNRFAERGIAPQRVRVVGWLPKQEHWDLYNQVDLALDTFPYNGGLTNLEALWMGVPTVTLAGDTFVARTGLAILTHAHLESLVTYNPEQMIATAVGLAQNLEVLSRLRQHLRAALQASCLCDAARLAAGVEAAYRQMWKRWCEENHA